MAYGLNGTRENGNWELALVSENDVGWFDEGGKLTIVIITIWQQQKPEVRRR